MRTGAEYRESVKDGRKVWVVGEGRIDDLTTHPATKGMVDEYAAWYDRHNDDPEWRDILWTPPDEKGQRQPVQLILPRSGADLRAMGKAFEATVFYTAGNMTHDPAYGNIISLIFIDAAQRLKVSQKQIDDSLAYRQQIQDDGRFLTFAAGGATIGYRMREDPAERAALRIVEERDDGLVLQGKIGMHTSPPFADDIYIGPLSGVIYQKRATSFIVPTNAPGVTVFCRKIAARHPNSFIAPLSHRFDELDGQLWLDNVFLPWERIFFMSEETEPDSPNPFPFPRDMWVFWHQLYCWFTKSEFTLGLALACADAMGLKQHQPTLEYLNDMLVDVETVRACLTAAEYEHGMSVGGYAVPNNSYVSAGSIAQLKARQRLTEILRILPGSSLVVAPSDEDLAAPEMAAGLEESFGGGNYTALQRSALLNLAWDHISSGLDGRESAFELHSNGGVPAHRATIRARYERYNELANAVLKALSVEMPEIDVQSVSQTARMQVREVAAAPRPTAAQ